MFTRRTATVTMSVPDASCALTITAGEEYLPVPTIKRERKDLPAMTRSSIWLLTLSPASDEVHDFHLVALTHLGGVEGGALENHEIVLHGHPARVDVEMRQQRRDRQRPGKLEGVAVQRDAHARSLSGRPGARARSC